MSISRTRLRRPPQRLWAGLVLWLVLSVLVAGAETAERPAAVRVLNRGVGGNTSSDGLARFQRDVVQARPDHLILYFGINDALNSGKLVPPARFVENMQAMIDRSPTRSIILVTPNPIIADYLVLRHPQHPRKDDLVSHLNRYDAAIRQLAKKNRLPLADLRKLVDEQGGATRDRGCLVRNTKNSGAKDGVHLTPEGYRRMAELFGPLLEDRIKPGQVVVCLGDSITYGAHVEGAGTSTGQTYPARLATLLDRIVGASPPKED